MSEQEIKPVATLILPGAYGGEFSGCPDIDWNDAGEPDRLQEIHVTGADTVELPMYIIPATHRIVPAELLERVLRALPNESVPWLCTKLQAIIDKEPT